MIGISRQDLVAWTARVAHANDVVVPFPNLELLPGALREFRGRTGVNDFFNFAAGSASGPQDFHAYALMTHVGGIRVFSTLHTSSEFDRVDADVVRDRQETLVAIAVLRGTMSYRHDGKQVTITAGDVIVANTMHPIGFATSRVVETLGLVVPVGDVSNDARFDAHRWPIRLPPTPLTAAFRAFLGRYLFEASVVPKTSHVQSVSTAEAAFYDVFRAALLQHQAPVASRDASQQTSHLRAAVHDLVDKYHVLHGFDAESIAKALHISRRKLYRDFAGEEQTVASVIAAKRIETASRLLITEPHATLGDVAAESGFGDATTMRRHFLARLGITPAEFRTQNV